MSNNLEKNFWITDFGLGKSMQQVLKAADGAEKAALKAGARVVKESIKKAVSAKGFSVSSRNSTYGHRKNIMYQQHSYSDRLIDAVRVGHINKRGKITIHAWGTRKKDSGTYRLRFFESSKQRYQKNFKGKRLAKPRYIGSLSKYNGWFASGFNASKGNVQPAMEKALEKYINKIWDK